MQLTRGRRNKSSRDGKRGQEATGGQQKEEKKIAQQELQQQKENRAKSVDSPLLEFITDTYTLKLFKCLFLFFFFFYIHFCNSFKIVVVHTLSKGLMNTAYPKAKPKSGI